MHRETGVRHSHIRPHNAGDRVARVQVQSTLVDVELPFGESSVPDMRTVSRARREDLNKSQSYRLAFTRNAAGKVIMDRRFNTAAMLAMYYGSFDSIKREVEWDENDPNDLSVRLPSGGRMQVRTWQRTWRAHPAHAHCVRCPCLACLTRASTAGIDVRVQWIKRHLAAS